jgi:hypothetical protein
LPRLPDRLKPNQWHRAAFVPDYSGGPVPDSHGVPYEAHKGHLNIPSPTTSE